MCRLFGYCSRGSASAASLLTEQGLQDFTALSAFHSDGWGMAWYTADGPEIRKSTRRAADEPDYDELARRALGDIGLVHLRAATPGLAVGRQNCHPFRYGGYTLAHNGAIHPQGKLGEMLPADWERQLHGTTADTGPDVRDFLARSRQDPGGRATPARPREHPGRGRWLFSPRVPDHRRRGSRRQLWVASGRLDGAGQPDRACRRAGHAADVGVLHRAGALTGAAGVTGRPPTTGGRLTGLGSARLPGRSRRGGGQGGAAQRRCGPCP